MNVGGSGSGTKWDQNMVSEGHSRDMRDTKDFTKNSASDMAAIFGVRDPGIWETRSPSFDTLQLPLSISSPPTLPLRAALWWPLDWVYL